MLTIFSTPKPFRGHIDIIQRNALKSWTLLHPDVEVILFGDEQGAAEVASEFGLRHEPFVERHESGMKYLDYMFNRAQAIARHDYLCYSNCDIILLGDFCEALKKTIAWQKRFLLVSQRWDTDVTTPVDFDRPDWRVNLHELAARTGVRQSRAFVDYFAFQRGVYHSIPPLVIGRWYWDWWLVWKALSSGVPVVDATPCVTAIHQNHDYGYHPQGLKGTAKDAVALRNFQLAGGRKNLCNLEDATYELKPDGHFRRPWLRRERAETWKFARDTSVRIWYSLLAFTYKARHGLGLSRQGMTELRTRFGTGRNSSRPK